MRMRVTNGFILPTILLCLMSMNVWSQGVDRMAEIGNKPAAIRLHLLQQPKPPELPLIFLPRENRKSSAFRPMNRLDTEQELEQELKVKRNQFKPFLQDLAPEIKDINTIIALNDFQWRKETEEDQKDFLGVIDGKRSWETVTLPHYGPPLGKAVTYYRTTFSVPSINVPSTNSEGRAIFIKLRGVDYKAHVFINGYHVGSHEGIFAPFEFDISEHLKVDQNILVIKVENDYPMGGHIGDDGVKRNGDKIYAATGPGYDDPVLGWHHSPPAMGIYQPVTIEVRSTLHIHDVFVRPLVPSDSAEVWVEIMNTELVPKEVTIRHSLYGQNFKEVVHENLVYQPLTIHVPGVGDLAKPTDNKLTKLLMGGGLNFLKFKVHIPNSKKWNPETPWLYQIQLQLVAEHNRVTDSKRLHFGMRSFTMDTLSVPKGMMYLNGNPIRLRGANTMGSFQQCVMNNDTSQLIDDILMAKITNMNFIRMTQLPVQSEVYEYCDKLGLMTQTDLPLFGVLRKNKWLEAVRQAEEMERLVRKHPSNILVTYINERFPNGEGAPHRHIDSYHDFARFFTAADQAILMANPDRVIKAGDGDYDPPSPGLPDNHVYNGWYNGHGLGLGEMHKGFWIPVKPDWYFACGEFGSEGLDNLSTMKKHYPSGWLPKNDTDPWTPERIAMNQTLQFHRMWYQTPKDINGWIESSQTHQAEITRLTTEALRRENRIVSFAIHLFIDAWPAGWMKSIVDVERKPKKAWFEYRHALSPIAVQVRTDRYHVYSGETLPVEGWVVNDMNKIEKGHTIKYQLEKDGKVIWSNQADATVESNRARFQGFIKVPFPEVRSRTNLVLRLALFLGDKPLHETDIVFTVFPKPLVPAKKVFVMGRKASSIAQKMPWTLTSSIDDADVFVLDSLIYYEQRKHEFDGRVTQGKKLVFVELPVGRHLIGTDSLVVSNTVMGDYYFVSKSDHPMVQSFQNTDFRFWFDARAEVIRPILSSMVNNNEWSVILRTGTTQWASSSSWSSAVCEKKSGKGYFRICQLQFDGKIKDNPTAFLFLQKLVE